MIRLLLLNDTRDHSNWGSQATADALLSILREPFESVEIESLESTWTKRRYWQRPSWLGSTVVTKRHRLLDRRSKPLDFVPTIADEFDVYADRWTSGKAGPAASEYIEMLKRIDAVVFNAEGAVYRNNYTAIKSLFMLWLAKERFGIPSFFVNGSVTLTRVDPILPAIVERTFGVLDGIAIREPVSLANLKQFHPEIDANVVPDAAFHIDQGAIRNRAVQPSGIRASTDGRPYFCFSLSMLPMDYLADPASSSLVRLIRSLQEVVPNAVLMAKDSEDQFLSAVAERTGAEFFGPERSYWEQLRLLEKASFLVSGRYHHNILAMMTGCPSIPLTTTSHKIEGLCELVDGTIGPPYDATYLHPVIPEIQQTAGEIMADRGSRSRALISKADSLRRRTALMGTIVAEALAGPVKTSQEAAL